VARGRELLALLRAGVVDGLSIGFRTVKGRVDPASRVRRIIDLDLWEISIVTFPLLSGARRAGVERGAGWRGVAGAAGAANAASQGGLSCPP
jgi:HK97 family phage prohead protease